MVQTVHGGAPQAAGKRPGDFRHATCSFFLGTNSNDRTWEGHICSESWEPLWRMWLKVEKQDILFSWGKEERVNWVPLPLGVIAFGLGKVKWNRPEQTFSGTAFKVSAKVALPQNKGLREFPTLCVGSARKPWCQQWVSAILQRPRLVD